MTDADEPNPWFTPAHPPPPEPRVGTPLYDAVVDNVQHPDPARDKPHWPDADHDTTPHPADTPIPTEE
ncbi:hypothetical protein [Saccharomonospora saliphila]|uniref:hypothetical protein n=1 Tax=Saccharomonospora saliphila TaxID=369829 RepID=UPI00036B2FCF|nr:hypothetical protein [Saccharomonospora saliphila]